MAIYRSHNEVLSLILHMIYIWPVFATVEWYLGPHSQISPQLIAHEKFTFAGKLLIQPDSSTLSQDFNALQFNGESAPSSPL